MASRRDWTILLVDDNQALADNLREILQDVGYGVKLATSVASARAIDVAFDVALVDVRLPDGEGTALGAELKAKWPDAEVILMTGFASLESAVAAVRAGAWAYLTKPCSPNDLLLAIRQALRHVMLVEEKRELARRTLIAEKMAAVGTLAAGLSHEIRNPLNAASLQLTLLERRLRRLDVPTSEQLLDPLLLVQHEIKRLSEIVADYRRDPRYADFILRVECAADVGAVRMVPHRWEEALRNLLDNALVQPAARREVVVRAERHADEVVTSVRDYGPGVSAGNRDKIFRRFFSQRPPGVAPGTGLGLSIVQAVAKAHGGQVEVRTPEDGPGALFVITLRP